MRTTKGGKRATKAPRANGGKRAKKAPTGAPTEPPCQVPSMSQLAIQDPLLTQPCQVPSMSQLAIQVPSGPSDPNQRKTPEIIKGGKKFVTLSTLQNMTK